MQTNTIPGERQIWTSGGLPPALIVPCPECFDLIYCTDQRFETDTTGERRLCNVYECPCGRVVTTPVRSEP